MQRLTWFFINLGSVAFSYVALIWFTFLHQILYMINYILFVVKTKIFHIKWRWLIKFGVKCHFSISSDLLSFCCLFRSVVLLLGCKSLLHWSENLLLVFPQPKLMKGAVTQVLTRLDGSLQRFWQRERFWVSCSWNFYLKGSVLTPRLPLPSLCCCFAGRILNECVWVCLKVCVCVDFCQNYKTIAFAIKQFELGLFRRVQRLFSVFCA